MTAANEAIELRAIKQSTSGNDVWVGYFNDPAILTVHAECLNAQGYHIYSPINPIRQTGAVVARLNQPPARGGATSNADIARRLVLPYDIDAVRAVDEVATAAGNSKAKAAAEAAGKPAPKLKVVHYAAATNEERQAAKEVAQAIRDFWCSQGVEPKCLDSGNGYQIFLPINLPNDDESEKLVKDVLAAHRAEFETPGAKVDCWSDAARILRIPGYKNVKGDNSDPARPHRKVRLLCEPSGLATRKMLEEVRNKAASARPDRPAVDKAAPTAPDAISVTDERGLYTLENVEVMLAGISTRLPEFTFESGKKTSYGRGFWVTCPNADEHSTPEGAITDDGLTSTTVVWVNERGFANFRCQHSHCQHLKWHQFVELTKSEDLQNIITKPWLAALTIGSAPVASNTAPPPGAPTSFVVDASPVATVWRFTDSGNAELLVAVHGEDFKYLHDAKKWLHWDARRWSHDGTAEINRAAKAAIRAMPERAKQIEDDEKRKKFLSHAAKSESRASLDNMVTLARNEKKVAALSPQFDKDQWLLNVLNGTVDLKTGVLREHRREDLMTKLCPVEFDPSAKCPRWLLFLEEIFPSQPETISFLQRSVGYSLTGDTEEQCFWMLIGVGKNGKSKFMEAIKALLGDYAVSTSMDTFTAKRTDGNAVNPRDGMANLAGARLVWASESDEGKRLSEAAIKAMTGGESIRTAKIYQDDFEFKPTFKIWLSTNHELGIRGSDEGIWRRPRRVNFDFVVPVAQRDLQLGAKLQTEMPGILNWALEGLRNYQVAGGLKPPKAVEAATEAYRRSQSLVERFIEERCIRVDDEPIEASAIYQEFQSWSTASGEKALSQKRFGAEMKKLFRWDRITTRGAGCGRYAYFGIQMLESACGSVAPAPWIQPAEAGQ
jgi:P4 family phage/plasmid primase-like protien